MPIPSWKYCQTDLLMWSIWASLLTSGDCGFSRCGKIKFTIFIVGSSFAVSVLWQKAKRLTQVQRDQRPVEEGAHTQSSEENFKCRGKGYLNNMHFLGRSWAMRFRPSWWQQLAWTTFQRTSWHGSIIHWVRSAAAVTKILLIFLALFFFGTFVWLAPKMRAIKIIKPPMRSWKVEISRFLERGEWVPRGDPRYEAGPTAQPQLSPSQPRQTTVTAPRGTGFGHRWPRKWNRRGLNPAGCGWFTRIQSDARNLDSVKTQHDAAIRVVSDFYCKWTSADMVSWSSPAAQEFWFLLPSFSHGFWFPKQCVHTEGFLR